MISQHKFNRVRIQVALFLQVGFLIFSHIMVYENNGRDEGYETAVVILN